jgi:hypothetical protein
MSDNLTKEELDLFELVRSYRLCGTMDDCSSCIYGSLNMEEQDKSLKKLILEARTPAKKPLLKKISPFFI